MKSVAPSRLMQRRLQRLTTRPGKARTRASFPERSSPSSSIGAARNGGTAPSARAAGSRCWRSETSIAGYANYGRNRARSLYYDGEIYELYLRPEFQGLGFGRKLFGAARRDLQQSGMQSLVVWALSDNEPAVGFYRALGGKAVARSSERFGTRVLDKVAFAWNG